MSASSTARHLIGAFAIAGLTLAVALAFRYAKASGVVDPETSTRVVTAFFGLIVAWSGNMMPKTLTPLARMRCDPARSQARQRRAGWAFVLAGLGWSVSWLVLPLPAAMPISMLLLMFGAVAALLPFNRLAR
jgi:hypothetical protein